MDGAPRSRHGRLFDGPAKAYTKSPPPPPRSSKKFMQVVRLRALRALRAYAPTVIVETLMKAVRFIAATRLVCGCRDE
jgi:hypothetical protein